MFGLQGPEAYAYTSLSNCLDVQDIDDVREYADTIVRVNFASTHPSYKFSSSRKQCKPLG